METRAPNSQYRDLSGAIFEAKGSKPELIEIKQVFSLDEVRSCVTVYHD